MAVCACVPLGPNDQWQFAGRMGMELESMPLMVYNGKMYGRHRCRWRKCTGTKAARRADTICPARSHAGCEVSPRGAWRSSGAAVAGVLPSGHVHSIQIGRQVTYDRPLAAGWQHVAAVREVRQPRCM
ncbi:MAG: hypothetical protein U0992_11990 [Planctomycetaceae bacterium]